ncbi:reverse transcriptase domain-containing protein [Tanacetum coccineum]|uniref:Reverse transcriptase domain-containing protein n=1 Tax=Tanacetum coccineum TaxID=301880 RepID=A0ABQ5CPQ7_9ASTR
MKDVRKRLGPKGVRSAFGSPEPRRGRSKSPRKRNLKRKTVFKRLEKGVFRRLGDKEKVEGASSRKTEQSYQKVKDSKRRTLESQTKSRGQTLKDDDLSQQRICEETDPFTPRIRYFDLPKRTRMPSHGWFDDLPPEFVDSYDDLKEAFLANFLWQKKCIKDPMEIHHIKQREGESTEDFMCRFKIESRDVKRAPEVMRISGFMHGITNPELIKCLHDKIPRSERRQDIFTPFSKSPKDIMALEKGKFKTPPPMTTSVKKRNSNKFCDFHGEMVARQRITQSFSPGLEISFPPLGEEEGIEGPMIIEAEIGGHCTWMADQPRKYYMNTASTDSIGDEEHSTSAWMNFIIVRSSSPYNIIIGRLRVRKIQAVLPTAHRMLKFPIAGGILTLRSSKIIPIECATVSGPEGQLPAVNPAIEERIKDGRNKLCDLLRRNLDVFGWKPVDMTDVLRHIAEHRLNVREGCSPVRPKKRGQAADREPGNTRRGGQQELGVAGSDMWISIACGGCTYWGPHGGRGGRDVVLSLPSLKCLKDVQKLNEKLASLNRFLAKLAEKSLPFFKNLKRCTKKSDFHWTTEAESAFKQMKQLIADLPTLTAPEEKEELIVYLAAAKEAGSAVLMTERDAKQIPIYFVSRALRGPKVNYTSMEKLVLVRTLTNGFQMFSIKQVPRSENKKADALSKIASASFAHLSKQVLVEELKEKSINEVEVLTVVEEEGDTWMTSIYEYLIEETLLAEVYKARAVRRKSQRFAVINGVFYKKSFLGPWLRNPQQKLTPITSPWPFYKLGIDKAVPFTEGLAHRTMIKSSNGDTPFSLTYGTKAVIPAKIDMPTLRTTEVDMVQNNKALRINLDLLEEKREQAAIREAKSKTKMEKYYKSKVRSTSFKLGDLVYHNNDASHAEEGGKLSPKWEGPYEITEALGNGAYKLRNHDGKQLLRTWNI